MKVDPNEVTQRLSPNSGGETEGDPGGDTFAHDTVVTQLRYEASSPGSRRA